MARVITKGLISLQDLALGTSTFTRATSTGGTQTLNQINSSNLGSGFPLNLSSPVIPTGLVNGVNKIFTLPTTPTVITLVFQNGLLLIPGGGNDYTISGAVITFVVAPLVGDVIAAVY